MTSSGQSRTAAGWVEPAAPRQPVYKILGPLLRRQAPLVLAAAVLLVITVLSLLIPMDIHLASLLVAVPALTATLYSALATIHMTVLACAGSVAVDLHDGLGHSPILPIHVLDVLVVCGLVLAFWRMRHTDRQTLRAVRSVAETAQSALLRPLPCRVGCVDMATAYRSAAAHARIGGDLYAAERVEGAVRLLIGDVRGKGLAAVDDASTVLGAFREAAHRDTFLKGVAMALEASMARHFGQAGERDAHAGERFVTVLVAEIPDNVPVVRVISCGHPHPMLARGHEVDVLDLTHPAPPLGVANPGEDYRVDTFRFEVGDILLLHTDGLLEARDSAGVFYPALDRFASLSKNGGPDRVIERLLADLTDYTDGELHDDVALVAVRRRCADARSAEQQLGAPTTASRERRVPAAHATGARTAARAGVPHRRGDEEAARKGPA
ncbi:PP2C family protein-serine/threonine phosphatase [Streptomyces sp. NPDC002574]|uniref:PP2C family protein-serine/threonine phosphatase n=1 Tax=Streptomyces sp. NPDC002574 TaxID=3364652 RepID=UPI0036D11EC9